jgi:hypothetical protein
MRAPAPPPSDAYKKFMASTIMDYEKWHDGIGYDLDAFKQMTPAEQERVVAELKDKSNPDWRDVEIFEIAGTAEADAALRDALDHGPPEARLHAMETLASQGKLPDVDERLAKMLDRVSAFDGLDPALRMAEEHRGPKVRMALLRGAKLRPEVGVHYAAMLFYYAGITKEAFDWDHRPFFLRFGEDSSKEDRQAAFLELCERVGVDPKTVK